MRFVRILFIVIGAVTTFAVFGGLVAAYLLTAQSPEIPTKSLLRVDLDRTLVEYLPESPLAFLALGKRRLSLRDVVTAIERAATDERVVGLVARVDSSGMGLATVQEVRDALATFRGAEKPTFVHAESFGEFSAGNGSYYLASGFEYIYLQPSGNVGLTGLLAQSLFLKGAFEKLDIKARLDHREEYKGIKDIFTEERFTAPQREAVTRVLESLSEQIVQGIGKGRGLSTQTIRDLMQQAPLSAAEALQAKLVDALLYRDQVEASVKEKVGQDIEVLPLESYLSRLDLVSDDQATVALIYGIGQIQRGRSEYSPFTDSLSMGSSTVAGAFRAAVDDEQVQAILFRVDSPGGSYVASDTMWREVVRAREHGKAVVVSMGNVAGSGGYFVAAPADKIVAQPATITGSIGVAAGKIVTRGLWHKLGVSWDGVSVNSNATFWSDIEDYNPEQWNRLEHLLDLIYDDFVTKVAEGRKLPKEKVLAVAKGRIWTGEDAKQRGLVDELGGYATALKVIRQVANIPPDRGIALKVFPARKSKLDLLLARFLGEDDEGTGIKIRTSWTGLKDLAPFVRQLRGAVLPNTSGVLGMEPIAIQ